MNSKAVKLGGKKHRYVISAFGVLELTLITYQQKYPAVTSRENKSEQWILIFIYLLIFYYICRKRNFCYIPPCPNLQTSKN